MYETFTNFLSYLWDANKYNDLWHELVILK